MANSFYEHSGYPPGSRARNSSQKLRAEFSAIEAGAQAIETALALKADAADVSEVDNTSDADKPISRLTQAALDLKADYSALVDFNPATAGADKMLVTNAAGDGWEYPSITAAGKALLDDADAAAQRATLGLPSDALTRSRKNLLINGGFDVWQRGTSFTATGTYYTADRWEFVNGPGGGGAEKATHGIVITYTFSGAQTFRQKIENVRKFSDTTVTFSFNAWDDLSTGGVVLAIKATQNFGTGGTTSAPVVVSAPETVAVTSSEKRYTATIALPSISGKVLGTNNDSFLMIEITPSRPSSDKAVGLDLCQLEFGDTATDFEYRHPAEELMLCQRYYEAGGESIPKVANMLGTSILRANAIPFKVTKRRVPSMTIGALTPSGHDGTPGAIDATYQSTDEFCSQWNWTGGTAGRAVSAQFAWTADAEIY